MSRLRRFSEMSRWDKAVFTACIIALAGWVLYGANLIWGLSKPFQILALILILPWSVLTIVDLVRKTRNSKMNKDNQ